MGFFGMILTKETYIIHVGCAAIARPGGLGFASDHARGRREAGRGRRGPTPISPLVIVAGLVAIVFFYSGTFFNWPGLKGLYGTFDAWFKTGQQRQWP